MRAAVLSGQGRLELTDLADPTTTSPDEVVIEVRSAGVCGTDLHFFQGLLDPAGFPRILGHEIAGTVVANNGVSDGTRVAVYNVLHCGRCSYCVSGRQRLCSNSGGMLGFNVDGGFAEYLVVPRRNLVPLPDSVPFDWAAALACSGMSAVHAVRLAGVGLGDVVVVDGIGGVGLMLIQVAKASGAHVIAVGDNPDKLGLANSSGADNVILIENDDQYQRLSLELARLDLRPGSFFETVGTAASMAAGYAALEPGGAFVQIGYTKDRIDIHPAALIKNELRLITSAAGSLRDLETAVHLAASRAIEPVVNRCGGLEAIPSALEALASRAALGRSVVWLG